MKHIYQCRFCGSFQEISGRRGMSEDEKRRKAIEMCGCEWAKMFKIERQDRHWHINRNRSGCCKLTDYISILPDLKIIIDDLSYEGSTLTISVGWLIWYARIMFVKEKKRK